MHNTQMHKQVPVVDAQPSKTEVLLSQGKSVGAVIENRCLSPILGYFTKFEFVSHIPTLDEV